MAAYHEQLHSKLMMARCSGRRSVGSLRTQIHKGSLRSCYDLAAAAGEAPPTAAWARS